MFRSKYILNGPYLATHSENRMANEGDTQRAREVFLKNRFRNLNSLLAERYQWMNDFIKPNQIVWEVGAGAGFSPLFIDAKINLSDVVNNNWVDKHIDATKMQFEDNSVDVIIASHTIHHFAKPFLFFEECKRVLRPGGYILISEIHTSLLMRFLLRVMRHEGWSYEPDVFDENTIANDASDPWSANCAIPELLFSNSKKFENNFDGLEIVKNEVHECLLFPLSGGVIAKTKVPKLPQWLLKAVIQIDKILVALAPSVFGLGMKIAIRKK